MNPLWKVLNLKYLRKTSIISRIRKVTMTDKRVFDNLVEVGIYWYLLSGIVRAQESWLGALSYRWSRVPGVCICGSCAIYGTLCSEVTSLPALVQWHIIWLRPNLLWSLALLHVQPCLSHHSSTRRAISMKNLSELDFAISKILWALKMLDLWFSKLCISAYTRFPCHLYTFISTSCLYQEWGSIYQCYESVFVQE